MTTPHEPAPIRKSSLPTTPPAEWEFSTVLATRPDGLPGCFLLPGDMGGVVVRRRVQYGDWEPVRPDRWAEEPFMLNNAIAHWNEYDDQRDQEKNGEEDPSEELARLRREVAAARTFAAEMRDFCSPHGVATDYADRLIEAMDRAKGEHRDPAADILAAEWHRRYQRLEDLSRDPDTPATVLEHVRGELAGLRGALGVLLGGDVQGGTADLLGWSYYQEWRRRQEGGR